MVSNQYDRIFGIFFLKRLDLHVWRFTVFQQNKPTVMASWYLTQVHFHKVLWVFYVFVDDVLLDFPHDNGFAFNSSQVGLVLDEVNYAWLGFSIKDNILSVIKEVVGLGVFGGLENLINFDGICLMVVFDSE